MFHSNTDEKLESQLSKCVHKFFIWKIDDGYCETSYHCLLVKYYFIKISHFTRIFFYLAGWKTHFSFHMYNLSKR